MDPVAALEAGLPVLLPTDTVYGLVSAPGEEPARTLYELKGRARTQPTALLAATIEALLEAVPELDAATNSASCCPARTRSSCANPARPLPVADRRAARTDRRPRPAAAGGDARRSSTRSGVVLATSANDPGGPNPVTLDDVPRRIRDGCGAELDLGPLPGTPSTVIDLTRDEPRILREGAVPATEALRRLRA